MSDIEKLTKKIEEAENGLKTFLEHLVSESRISREDANKINRGMDYIFRLNEIRVQTERGTHSLIDANSLDE